MSLKLCSLETLYTLSFIMARFLKCIGDRSCLLFDIQGHNIVHKTRQGLAKTVLTLFSTRVKMSPYDTSKQTEYLHFVHLYSRETNEAPFCHSFDSFIPIFLFEVK